MRAAEAAASNRSEQNRERRATYAFTEFSVVSHMPISRSLHARKHRLPSARTRQKNTTRARLPRSRDTRLSAPRLLVGSQITHLHTQFDARGCATGIPPSVSPHPPAPTRLSRPGRQRPPARGPGRIACRTGSACTTAGCCCCCGDMRWRISCSRRKKKGRKVPTPPLRKLMHHLYGPFSTGWSSGGDAGHVVGAKIGWLKLSFSSVASGMSNAWSALSLTKTIRNPSRGRAHRRRPSSARPAPCRCGMHGCRRG